MGHMDGSVFSLGQKPGTYKTNPRAQSCLSWNSNVQFAQLSTVPYILKCPVSFGEHGSLRARKSVQTPISAMAIRQLPSWAMQTYSLRKDSHETSHAREIQTFVHVLLHLSHIPYWHYKIHPPSSLLSCVLLLPMTALCPTVIPLGTQSHLTPSGFPPRHEPLNSPNR